MLLLFLCRLFPIIYCFQNFFLVLFAFEISSCYSPVSMYLPVIHLFCCPFISVWFFSLLLLFIFKITSHYIHQRLSLFLWVIQYFQLFSLSLFSSVCLSLLFIRPWISSCCYSFFEFLPVFYAKVKIPQPLTDTNSRHTNRVWPYRLEVTYLRSTPPASIR